MAGWPDGRSGSTRGGQILQKSSGRRLGNRRHLLWSTRRNNTAALRPGTRSQIDHPIGAFDDVEVVLDYDDRVAGIHQPVEHATEHAHVVEMEARRGLVEDVQLPLPAAAPAAAGQRELARNLETLGLTAGERRRGLAELQITETHLLEVPEATGEPRMAMQSLDRLVHCPLERPSDAEPLQLDVEHFALEPRSAADFAGHEDVGEEHHFDEHVPGAFARLASSTRDVERERTGRIPARTRERFIGK